ncbi:MAG: hypothetical protein V3V62_13915 [bacterium]
MEARRFKMDEEWHDMPEGVETFGALRAWAMDHFKEKGRVFLGALHGEASLSHDQMAEWEGSALAGFDTLEFLSADPEALARRTCADTLAYLDWLEERMEETCRNIGEGEIESARVGLKECAEGWSLALNSFLNLLQMAGKDLSTAEVGGRSLTVTAADLKEILEKIVQKFRREEMEGVDELISDLSAHIEPMREAFERLQIEFE